MSLGIRIHRELVIARAEIEAAISAAVDEDGESVTLYIDTVMERLQLVRRSAPMRALLQGVRDVASG